MWFIGVEVEQETTAPYSKKNPGSAPGVSVLDGDIYQVVIATKPSNWDKGND